MSTIPQHLSSARTRWLELHRYFGVFAGGFLALLAATGSILVFVGPIDRLLNPEIAVPVVAARSAAADEGIAAVERTYGVRPYYLEAPTDSGAYVAFVNARDRGAGVRAVAVDAKDGAVLSDRRWGRYFVSFIRELHTSLFLGSSGKYIVGAVGVCALASVLTGLYLWWPRSGTWRRALSFQWRGRAAALNFEVHRVAGFYIAVILFAIAFTGIYLALPGPMTALVGSMFPLTPEGGSSLRYERLQDETPLSLVRVQAAVERHTPGAVITGYELPDDGQPLVVHYRHPAEPYSQYGRSAMWVDPYDARILEAREYVRLRPADRYLLSQVLIHNGQVLGSFGRWLVLAAGVATPVMYGTGLYLWWRRRRTRSPRA